MSRRVMPLLAALLTLPLGCGGSSGGGAPAGATAAGTTSGSTAGTHSASGQPSGGPLQQKALAFEALMQAQHTPHGLVQDVQLDPSSGQVVARSGPSRCLWTGFYAASQAERWRATGDPQALAAMERSLWALHDLHAITGTPGVICRGFDDPRFMPNGFQGQGAYSHYNYDEGSPSRDQYSGWFYGVGACWDEIQDPALRQALAADVRAVCDLLMQKDLELEAPWGGPTGQVKVFFELDPRGAYLNNITPQTWAQVDDFPFNLITKAVPYDPVLAQALQQAQIPPIRAGEAIRAALLFTVAEKVTGDPRYTTYKQDFLFGPRDFAGAIDRNLTLLDDVLYNRNQAAVRQALDGLFQAIAHVFGAYLQATGRNQLLVTLGPIFVQGVGHWLSGAIVRLLDWVHDPNNQAKLAAIMQDARLLVDVLKLIGQQRLAGQIETALLTYGPHLSHQGLIEFAETVRSYLSVNLTVMPLALLAKLEPDPQLNDLYRRCIDREWEYIRGEHNPIVNFVHARYGYQADPADVPEGVDPLHRYPTDLSLRLVDNSNWPGLRVSVWPDRFGRVGRIASEPRFFPIDHRAPDIFPWRGHPRQIVSGADSPNLKIAPLGYLIPYWMGRDMGFLSAQD